MLLKQKILNILNIEYAYALSTTHEYYSLSTCTETKQKKS